jgi:hypothetical protein
MRPYRVYLFHPTTVYLPGITDWVREIESRLRGESSWDKWDLLPFPYNTRNSFDIQPLFVRVLNKPGPVVLLKKVHANKESPRAKAVNDLRVKLWAHSIVILREVGNSTDLWKSVEEARRLHEAGEPLLPRKFVVAVLIVRKLRKQNKWGGKDKGYLWHYDLARGRGVDDRFADIVHEVANDLCLQEILINKTSQGERKYALNPDRKAEVHAIADDGTFTNKHIKNVLMRDQREESVSYLYEPHTVQGFTILFGGVELHQCAAVADAISHAERCQDGAQYEARVKFQNGHVLREFFEERRILLQFLEAFI